MSNATTKQVTVVYKDGSSEVVAMPIRKRWRFGTAYVRFGSALVKAGKAVAGISGDRGYIWVGHNGDSSIFHAATAGTFRS